MWLQSSPGASTESGPLFQGPAVNQGTIQKLPDTDRLILCMATDCICIEVVFPLMLDTRDGFPLLIMTRIMAIC